MNRLWLPTSRAPANRPTASTQTTRPLGVSPTRRSTASAKPEPVAVNPRAETVDRMLMALVGHRRGERLFGPVDAAADAGRHLHPVHDPRGHLLGGLLSQQRVSGQRQPVG